MLNANENHDGRDDKKRTLIQQCLPKRAGLPQFRGQGITDHASRQRTKTETDEIVKQEDDGGDHCVKIGRNNLLADTDHRRSESRGDRNRYRT